MHRLAQGGVILGAKLVGIDHDGVDGEEHGFGPGQAQERLAFAADIGLAGGLLAPVAFDPRVMQHEIVVGEEIHPPERLFGPDRVEESLLECGLEIDRHEKVMAKLNEDLQIVYEAYSKPAERKAKADLVKGQMAAETREHKEAINRPLWMLTKRLEPTALLAHTGAPKTLVDSPEWRTHEAQLLAAKARADAALAQAQMAEMNANMALMEANMNLMKIRKAMAEQQEAMAKQMKEMNDFVKPVKELKESKSKAPRTEKPAKAEKPMPKGANVLSTRGSILQPTFRRGM